MKVDCQYRSNPDSELAVCYAAKNEVHILLCDACRKCGDPDPRRPNRHLASAILGGFFFRRHNNVALANLARLVILKAQIEDKGLDFRQWLGNRRIRPLKALPPKTTSEPEKGKCAHLGREMVRFGCGCWRKSTWECTAKDGLHIIPEANCPCPQYEES